MIDLIDRFGEQIEYDLLTVAGIDILDFYKGIHPWGRLFRFLRQLPRTSRYHAAVADDDDRAQALVQSGVLNDDPKPCSPPLETWTQEAELLALIADLLAHQRADYAQVHSKRHRWKAPKPVPRPETALDRVRRRVERNQHHKLIDSMLPTPPASSD